MPIDGEEPWIAETELPGDEVVFRALAHPVRRALLDMLREQDGLTLKQLTEPFATEMTRQGVSRHLDLLEEAHLVLTRTAGKEKLHHLNAAPVQEIYDRWVSLYARPWARAITNLKRRAAPATEENMHHPELIIETFIEATPERLWQALIDPDDTERYYYEGRMDSAMRPGSDYFLRDADGGVMISGKIVSADPPRELVMTFLPAWVPAEKTRPSRVTFTIKPLGAVCKLTLQHDQLSLEDTLAGSYRGGWSRILAGLKTLVETGRAMAPVGQADGAM